MEKVVQEKEVKGEDSRLSPSSESQPGGMSEPPTISGSPREPGDYSASLASATGTRPKVTQRRKRNQTEHFLFGQPTPLQSLMLPTKMNLVRAFQLKIEEAEIKKLTVEVKSALLDQVVEEVTLFWEKATIPCQARRAIKTKLARVIDAAFE